MPDPSPPLAPPGRALTVLLWGVTLALAVVLAPFHGAVLWGVVIAVLFRPLHCWLLQRLGERPTLAALLTLLVAMAVVVLPFGLLTAALAREATGLYQRLQSGTLDPARYIHGVYDALPAGLTSLLARLGLEDFDALQRKLAEWLAQASRLIAGQAFNLGQNTFEFIANGFITMYLAYFLVRDGDRLMAALRRALPLAQAHQQALLGKFGTVVRATVKGNLVVAAVQGALGGLAFWWLDLDAALLWAVLMAGLSLLPAVGAGLVWAPVALYLFATGHVWQGAALTAWGVLVIGLIDNLLRPVLVGKDTRLPDYVVMVSTLGGLSVFGVNGFLIGPLIAAMFVAVWHIEAERRHPIG